MLNLKRVLQLNALSCTGFGLLFLFRSAAVASFLSVENSAPPTLITVLGVVLIFNGLHLAWASVQDLPDKRWINYFSIGDFAWVLATLLIILMGVWITNTQGIITALIVAAFVGSMGLMQIKIRKQMPGW
jgi:hypothetical protein